MKGKITLAALAICATFWLTACSISFTMQVKPDGSGKVGMIYKFTEEDKNLYSSMGLVDVGNLCDPSALGSQGGATQSFTFKQEKHGNETWCVAEQSYTNLQDLRNEMAQQEFLIRELSIREERFYFDGSLDLRGENSSDATLPVGMTFELSLPGKAGTHNASEVKGNTLIWNLQLGIVNYFQAESDTQGEQFNFGNLLTNTWVIVVLIALCIIVLLALLLREMSARPSGRERPPEDQPPSEPGIQF